MLKLHLYRDCILSHDYNEVFHYSVFEDYLATLSSKTINIDYAYQTLSGTFYFDVDFESNIYKYNYMKIEQINEDGNIELVRYCFIKSISVYNNVATLNYEEDIWQSYSETLSIRDSYLSRSKFLNYRNNNILMRNLPIEYQGFNALTDQTINEFDLVSQKYMIIAQFQLYNTDSWGSATTRTSFVSLIYQRDLSTKIFNLETAIKYIDEVYNSVVNHLPLNNNKYYQVDNIILLPVSLFNANILDYYFNENAEYNDFDTVIYPMINDSTPAHIAIPKLNETDFAEIAKSKHFISSFIINNNFKNVSIGTMTNQFELVNNGLSRTVKLYIEFNTYNFDLYLEFDNKMVAITNDFMLNIPYDNMTGEVLAQRKMSRALNNIKAVGNIVEGAVQTYTAIGTAGASETILASTKLPKNLKARSAKSFLSAKKSLIDISEEENSTSGIGKIVQGVSNLIATNAPNFTSSKGTFTYDDGILNAYYGIVLKSMISQNDSYVESFINNTGYITYQIGGNEFLENYYDEENPSSPTYNVLKFEFVKAYGCFPQNICDALKEILINGFKIRYTENV